jgi:hypothetical protein
MTQVLERAKTFRALDCTSTEIGLTTVSRPNADIIIYNEQHIQQGVMYDLRFSEIRLLSVPSAGICSSIPEDGTLQQAVIIRIIQLGTMER